MLREARGGLKVTVGNRVITTLLHSFCSFLFLSTGVLVSPAGNGQKHASTYWTCGPKPGLGLKNIFKFVYKLTVIATLS